MADTGYMNRKQQEAAQIFKTEMDGELTQLQKDQIPKEYELAVKNYMLDAQKVAILAKEAETHREQLRVYERLEKARQALMSEMQGRQIQHEKSESKAGRDTQEHVAKKGREQQDKALDQQNEHFYVNQVTGMVDRVMSAVIPWYEPAKIETFESKQYDKNGNKTGSTESKRTTTRQ